MRIGIAGITGRLGALCAEEVVASRLDLAGGLSRKADPARHIVTDPATLADRCDVVIDVSSPEATCTHAEAFAKAGCAWVIGTTGFDAAQEAAITQAAQTIPVLKAANFAPGLTLLLDLARQLGAKLPADEYDAEILETHHRQKRDAPSGTALAIGERFAEGRNVALANVTEIDRSGLRGEGAIGFASLRAGQIVGEHSLILTSGTEQITLSHRAFDRRVFAQGAVKAARWLAGKPAGLYTMTEIFEA
ncbi:4-hydroxy-tetrahydrodipicolinate reductase [Asaia sp. W19]|uniref:4-hydroxy-tetrahydrodipicolinate reductase n=1 Tax=unclassified Asaia TaxID=2685023 RepID=UPI000F8CE3E9|nr:4-hydroxy-tetrahydrodipicolinate reductase [Asaia sp. W19]RUT27587.1 4-hydroxy-tetrahydrodipicolinate reductase [Asaia sp. W19]